MSNLTEKDKKINVLKSRIYSYKSDIENLESEIYDLKVELEELEDED